MILYLTTSNCDPQVFQAGSGHDSNHGQVFCHLLSSNMLPGLSGVLQSSILRPLLFLIYINDITSYQHSQFFADNMKCFVWPVTNIQLFMKTPIAKLVHTNNLHFFSTSYKCDKTVRWVRVWFVSLSLSWYWMWTMVPLWMFKSCCTSYSIEETKVVLP